MKRSLHLISSQLAAFVVATAAFAHDYGTNGVCSESGCDAPYQEPELIEGWYQLQNAGNVEWFSAKVNAGGNDTQIRGCLVADVDFTGVKHTPIGDTEGNKFNGKFDGRFHRILNMKMYNSTRDLQGFFGGLRGGGTEVRNLILDKSCTIRGKQRVGGIAAFAQTIVEGPIIIANCVNEATVIGSSTAVGGILGGSMSPHPAIHIIDCANIGKVQGSGESAAIAGWCGDNSGSLVERCFNMGSLTGMDGEHRNIARAGGAVAINDVYDLKPASGAAQGVRRDWATSAPLASGELCYALNAGGSTCAWTQTIGTDTHPWPFPDGDKVYLTGNVSCYGTALPGQSVFSNADEGQTTTPHTYVNGYCGVCADLEPGYEFAPRKVFLMAGQSNADGRPAVSTMPQYIRDYVSKGGSRFCYWSYCNGSDAAWSKFGGKLVPYIPYTDNNTTSRCGFDGIVYHLIEEELHQRFYVIKESHGGTAIDTRCSSGGDLWWNASPEWLRTASPRSGHSLVLEFTENIGLCIDNVLSQLSEGYDIQCIMWHQGESDRTQASSYEGNLTQVVAYLRSFLVEKTGNPRYATLPFLAGTVNRKSTQYNAEVEQALYRIADKDPYFHVVDMSDCQLGSDNLHFDAKGCLDAANRMLAKLKELGLLVLNDPTDVPSPSAEGNATDSSAVCYDMGGRHLSYRDGHLPQGLYISRNRKVLVR